MVFYLLREFKVREKSISIEFKKVGIHFWIMLCIYFLIVCLFSLVTIYTDNVLTGFIAFFFALVGGYFFMKYIEKNIRNKSGKEIDRYKKRLSIIRELLKEFNLYSEKQVKYLLDLNNKQMNDWNFSSKIFKPIAIVISTTVVPTLMIAIKWIYDHAKTSYDVITYSGLILLSILIILGIVFMIKPFVESILDKDFSDFRSLQGLLEDIYLVDFCSK